MQAPSEAPGLKDDPGINPDPDNPGTESNEQQEGEANNPTADTAGKEAAPITEEAMALEAAGSLEVERKRAEPVGHPVLLASTSATIPEISSTKPVIPDVKPDLPKEKSLVTQVNPVQGEGRAGNQSIRAMEAAAPQGPKCMASALHMALTGARTTMPRVHAWLELVQELFTKIYVKAKGPGTRLSDAAKRLPKLKKFEAERLLDLFELMVVDVEVDWEMWRNEVIGAALLAQRSAQPLESILWRSIGQAKVKKAGLAPPMLTGWKKKVAGLYACEQKETVEQKMFVFKKTVYSADEIEKLRKVCETDYGKFAPMKVREGTPDEWKIVQGLVEDTIIARQLPQFIRRIMKTEEQVKLVQTIRAQVEGCLIMDLRGESVIKEAFLSTKCIQESICTAASTRGSGCAALWKMITQVKNISYDRASHALYFHFFTRDMARKFENEIVPFHRYDHKVRNLHQAVLSHSGSAWDKQVDDNGEAYGQKGFYTCVIKNITRSVDLLKLSAFLRKLLGMEFQLNDLDTNGPHSDTSTSWELVVESDACPKVLLGIRRIFWGQTMLVMEHPSMGGRRQCLRCGELGHPMRMCQTAMEELMKSKCIQVTPEDYQKFSIQAPTFRSMEELRAQVEAVRVTQEEECKEEVEVDNSLPGQEHVMKGDDQATSGDKMQPTVQAETKRTTEEKGLTKAEASTAWTTVRRKKTSKDKNRREPSGEGQNVAQEATASSLKMAIDKEQTASQASNRRISTNDNSTVLDDGSDSKEEDSPKRGEIATSKLEELSNMTATKLLTKESKVKTYLKSVLKDVEETEGSIVYSAPAYSDSVGQDDLTTIPEVIRLLNLESVPTPATGNCQMFAVCQALASSKELVDKAPLLEDMTRRLKEGCLARALMDFDIKFPPGTRKPTLIELGRGYRRISPKESKKRFMTYLQEFSESESGISEIIPRNVWGSTDTLKTVSTLLQRDIFVLSHPPSEKFPGVQYYTPETRRFQAKSYQMSGEYPMMVKDFYAKMRVFLALSESEERERKRPLILRYGGQHYSAILLGRRKLQEEDVSMERSSDEEDFDDEHHSTSQQQANLNSPSGTGDGNESADLEDSGNDSTSVTCYQSPWDPDDWDGDYEDLLQRLQGPTIHHGLKCEITEIILTKDPRMCELLHFLTETVGKLSLPEQESLLEADLKDPEVRKFFLQKYQISEPILNQWVEKVWQDLQPEKECLLLSDGSPSSSEYKPSEGSINSQDVVDSDGAGSPTTKRVCRRDFPEEKAETNEGQLVARELMDDYEDENPDVVMDTLTIDEFKTAWHTLLPQWEEQTGIPFPLVSSTKTLWIKAAQADSNRLLHMIKDVPEAHYILDSVHSSVLVELTKHWREQCWLAVIEAGKREGLADIQPAWFEAWEHRFLVMIGSGQRTAILNSSQEWTRLRKIGYGGNDILQLLAPRKVPHLAAGMLCAHLFAEQIAALVGADYTPTDTILTLLQRHLELVRRRPLYATTIEGLEKGKTEAWREVYCYFHARQPLQITNGDEDLLNESGPSGPDQY